MKACGDVVAATLSAKEPSSATFDCDGIRKDLRIMVAEVPTRGFALRLAERMLAVYDQVSREGWGGRDCTQLPAYWADRNS